MKFVRHIYYYNIYLLIIVSKYRTIGSIIGYGNSYSICILYVILKPQGHTLTLRI